jgi:adenosylcobinamide-phosphate synthase
LVGKVAYLGLWPNPWFLAAGVVLDLLLGDPQYAFHPVRLMGWTLSGVESVLRRIGWNGFGGGILLFIALGFVWVGGVWALIGSLPRMAADAVHVFLIYSLLALRDLLRHGWAVEQAARRGDLESAQGAIAKLVGRDTSKMDLAACRRAAIESLSENLTDGFISPLFWYSLAGLPGLVLFKVVSTMDSMVGYKTPQYLRFGWCGARTDDLMNWIPARLTWLLISGLSFMLPGYSGRKSFLVGWRQHSIVPGPNSGWSEAAIAGAVQRRLVGPIWAAGKMVTDVWLGDPADPPAGECAGDFPRSATLVTICGISASAFTVAALVALY